MHRVLSSVSSFIFLIHPSAPNSPIKNLMIPCSVTLPLVTNLSLILASLPSFSSSQADAFQRTLSTIVLHPSYPLMLTFFAKAEVSLTNLSEIEVPADIKFS